MAGPHDSSGIDPSILDLLLAENPQATAQALAQRLRGQQMGQILGAIPQGPPAIGQVLGKQAALNQEDMLKAGTAALHYAPQLEEMRARKAMFESPQTPRVFSRALKTFMPEIDAEGMDPRAALALLPTAEKAFAAREAARQRMDMFRLRQTLVSPEWDPDAVEMAAQAFATTGKMPQLGLGNQPLRKQIGERAAQILKERAGGSEEGLKTLAGKEAGYSADKAALTKMTQMTSQIEAFENTAKANLGIMKETLQKLVDTGSPWLNAPYRKVLEQGAGDPNITAFHTARQVFVTEASRILNNPNLVGQLSDTARAEVGTLIRPDATIAQVHAAADILTRDMHNRVGFLRDQVSKIRSRVGQQSEPGQEETPPGIRKFKRDATGKLVEEKP